MLWKRNPFGICRCSTWLLIGFIAGGFPLVKAAWWCVFSGVTFAARCPKENSAKIDKPEKPKKGKEKAKAIDWMLSIAIGVTPSYHPSSDHCSNRATICGQIHIPGILSHNACCVREVSIDCDIILQWNHRFCRKKSGWWRIIMVDIDTIIYTNVTLIAI